MADALAAEMTTFMLLDARRTYRDFFRQAKPDLHRRINQLPHDVLSRLVLDVSLGVSAKRNEVARQAKTKILDFFSGEPKSLVSLKEQKPKLFAYLESRSRHDMVELLREGRLQHRGIGRYITVEQAEQVPLQASAAVTL